MFLKAYSSSWAWVAYTWILALVGRQEVENLSPVCIDSCFSWSHHSWLRCSTLPSKSWGIVILQNCEQHRPLCLQVACQAFCHSDKKSKEYSSKEWLGMSYVFSIQNSTLKTKWELLAGSTNSFRILIYRESAFLEVHMTGQKESSSVSLSKGRCGNVQFGIGART